MDPQDFLKLVYNSDGIVGNSSCAIRECSFLGVPAVNIGTRQSNRERGPNVVDVDYDRMSINKAINLFKNTDGLFTTSSKANCRSSKIDIEFEVEGTHAGFHAKWNSKCKKISELKKLTTMFFQIFPKAEELEVQIISEKSQSAIEWESDTKTIKIPKIHN